MIQRQPWITGPGSIADTLAKTLLALHGVEPRGAEKVHARGRAVRPQSTAVDVEEGDRQAVRRRSAALTRFNQRRKA